MAKKRRKQRAASPDIYKPPSDAEMMDSQADSMARTMAEAHPMVKKMRADMKRALLGVGKRMRGSKRGMHATAT